MNLDGYWFCEPPTREELRLRIDKETGRTIQIYTCPHGAWTDLSAARLAHGEIVDTQSVSELTS